MPKKFISCVEQIAAIRKLTKKREEALRRAEAMEQRVVRMKMAGAEEEPGPLTSDIICKKRGKKVVPRLHVRKGRSGEWLREEHR